MAEKDPETGTETTGHDWNGITELDTPMPRWWLLTFYATVIWGIGYTIAYPAWPLIERATPGLLGYSSRLEVAEDIARYNEANAGLDARMVETDLAAIIEDQELLDYSNAGGAAIFRTYCAQCHGAGAAGVQAAGYPNLLDDDWLWGGTPEDIYLTISHGIRWEADDDTRYSEMPAFGDDYLSDDEILQAASFVRSLSGLEADAALVEAGAVIFEENCAACHGADGTGDRSQGAPNLTDAVWLYGSSEERVVETIANSRFGMMPAWTGRLSPSDLRKVAIYIHQRGGGE